MSKQRSNKFSPEVRGAARAIGPLSLRTPRRYYRGDGDLGVERDRLGGRSRAKQQPPLFRTIQVCPKDRLTLPPAGS